MRGELRKQFWAFVQKEFKHIFRDPYTLLILMLMPVVELLLFGFALNMEVSHIRTAVISLGEDRIATHLYNKVRNNPQFVFYEGKLSVSEAEDLLQANKLDMYLVLPEDFEERLSVMQPTSLQMVVDATDPSVGKIRVAYASAMVRDAISDLMSGGNIPSDFIEVNSRMLYNPMMHSSYNFVPGIMGLVLIVICTIMTSVSIAREKERGSMELLLASPANATVMVLSKTVPFFVVSLINMVSILLLSYFVLEVPIRGSLLLIILITMIYIFVALAIGLAISSLVDEQKSAVMVSGFGMMMPTILLSGMLFPVANMPVLLQWSTYLVPARFYISAIRKVMIQGLGFMEVWQEVVTLLVFALVVIVLAIGFVKPRLK